MSQNLTPMKTVAPYGTWESPFDAKTIAEQGVTKENVLVDRITGVLYHVESRPHEDIVGEGWVVTTRVQEYGGAPALVHNGTLIFSDGGNGQVYVVDVESRSTPKQITSNSVYRFADFDVHPKNPNLVVCILEDHTHDTPLTIKTSLAVFDTSFESPTDSVTTLVSGADFYSNPRFNEDGTLIAWCQWDHPDMPWDGSHIYVAAASLAGNTVSLIPKTSTHICGTPGQIAAIQPTWFANCTLVYTSDESGYQNPCIADIQVAKDAPLVISQKSLLKDNIPKILQILLGSKDGRHVLYVIHLDGSIREVDTPHVHITRLQRISQRKVVFIGSKTDAPKELTICNFDETYKPTFSSIGASAPVKYISDISLPQPVTFMVERSPNGVKDTNKTPAHILLFPPHNSRFQGPENEKPCAIINVHGGPTSVENQSLIMQKQFFTSRGWMWIDVNYAGSSNYGRSYKDRLNGNWGVAHIEDCALVVHELCGNGLVDPARVVIRGGSAGGYTTLNSLSQSDPFFQVYKGGTSIYGISDLNRLYHATHKFQCRYIEGLIGGKPEEKPEVYHQRSPLFHASNIKVPLLILQGSIDPVVPPEQAEAIVAAITKKGGNVQYVEFKGESHGWRKAENIQSALELELKFYCKILGL
ncbi:alpha/beta-hydrolase [Cyathus striatus]|nr:alpha/beta-hydrolase [Cyathus striatus]